jgi:hypothetical protein
MEASIKLSFFHVKETQIEVGLHTGVRQITVLSVNLICVPTVTYKLILPQNSG